jgi:hypothetical protein
MNRPFERQVDSTPTLRHQRFHWRTRRDAALGQWPARHLAETSGDFRRGRARAPTLNARKTCRSSIFLNGSFFWRGPMERFCSLTRARSDPTSPVRGNGLRK